jgi:hypothetical protein
MTPTVAMVYSMVICKMSTVALTSISGYRTPACTWLGNRAPRTQGLRLYRSNDLASMQEWHPRESSARPMHMKHAKPVPYEVPLNTQVPLACAHAARITFGTLLYVPYIE